MLATPGWHEPPATLALDDGAVHVWRAALNRPGAEIATLEAALDADERARAARYRFAPDRARFIAAHAALRAILARYAGAAPDSLRFQLGPSGKPRLAPECAGDDLRFNLTHAGELALYAVTRGHEVGVDVELVRPDMASEAIAARFFAPAEAAALRRLPDGERTAAFFRCWTRKEAYVKARGDGFSLPLDQFEVSLAPGEPAALLSTAHDRAAAHRWSLRDLPIDPVYVAALAVEGTGWHVSCWQWIG